MVTRYPAPISPLFEVACEFLRRGNNKDFADPGSIAAPDYSFGMWPSTLRQPGEPLRIGADVFVDRMIALTDGFVEDFGMDVDHPMNVVEGKDCIVIQVSAVGTVKATGKKYTYESVHNFRFNDDKKVVAHDEFTDSAALMMAFADVVPPRYGPDGRIVNLEKAKKAAKA